MKFITCLLAISTLVSCTTSKKSREVIILPSSLTEAVNSTLRTPENQKRDIFRHPEETLNFFGITPEMTVVEIWPSGGWYTEILAPYLASKGKYIMADTASDPKEYTKPRTQWLEKYPSINKTVQTTVFSPGSETEIAPANSADLVLTFRNVHNWLPLESQEASFKVFFKALKPGGVLGVVEHRASTKTKFDPKSGYVQESEVIRMAKKAGFILKEKSQINANPKDSANHPEGVWTLPPRLRLGDKDKSKYLSIGESDRMTLKFVKPVK